MQIESNSKFAPGGDKNEYFNKAKPNIFHPPGNDKKTSQKFDIDTKKEYTQ
jgi:hypothetical protein